MAKSHFSQLTVALTAVVVSSVVAAAGLTIAQSGSETWSCDMAASGEKGQGPTTCGGQGRPAWPDCVRFVCSATTGTASGGCPGSPPTSTSWCDMSTGTPTWKESGGGGYTGGYTGGGMGSCQSPYPMGGPYNCDAGVFKCYGANVPDSSQTGMYTCTPSGWTKGGGTSGDGSTMPATCTACITAGGTQLSCPTCPGYTGGGSTSYGGGYTSGGGGSQSYGGGGGGNRWCFYNATRNGVALGYGVDCRENDAGNCYKESHSRANATMEPSAGLTLGSSSSCYWESGTGGGSYGTGGGYGTSGGYGTTGGYGGTGGGSMKRCFYPNASINGAKAGFTVWCAEDYVDCHEGSPSGKSISNTGLSLGAPNSCDSWGGKSSSSSGGTGGVGGTGGDGGMNCRDSDEYWKCIGGKNAPMDPARSRSCEEKHCGFQGGDSGGTGSDGETCQQICESRMRGCKQRASVAYSPMWCEETMEECVAKCSGGGGGKKKCGVEPPFAESVKNLRCNTETGKWEWDKDTGNEEDFCQRFPDDPKCRKPGPGTLEEKLAALEKTISALDGQVENLKLELADAKDAVTEQNDEIRALKKEKAPKAAINAAKKELKALKKTVSAIVSKGKKLARELRFREKEYERLSRQLPFFPPPMAQ